MNQASIRTLAGICLTALFAPQSAVSQEDQLKEPIKVMSFNIRYGAADDGENSWRFRNHLVADTIHLYDPDLLGAQEALEFQVEFLKEALPEYGFHGVGRNDGRADGEFAPVYYKKSRFELMDSGHLWLSEDPETPGSQSWDAALPRMLSWVALKDKTLDTDAPAIIFANTHFDHRGVQARLESAKLIRARFESVEEHIPVILCGDFNTTRDGNPYQVITGGDSAERPLIDTYAAIHPKPSENEATFSSWRSQRRGSRIDWVLVSDQFRVLNAGIDYTQEDGRNPSDHYPVWANLRLK